MTNAPLAPVLDHEAFIGALVVWIHVPRGGYGYSFPVPGTIKELSLDGSRAKVEVQKLDGSTVVRSVKTSSLRWRGRGWRAPK